MMYFGHHMSAGGWAFSILATLIVIGLVVAAIVSLFSARGGQAGSAASASPAREILDRRLASGELPLEQYEQLCAALSEGHAASSDPPPPRPVGAPV